MTSDIIKKNVSLRSLNSLRLDSVAEYLATPASLDALLEALNYARDKRLAITVLGEATNVVLPPRLPGLAIKICLQGLEHDGTRVQARAGENWHQLVNWTLDLELYGLENLSLIPGTVGAAPMQNIGAYGVELSEFVQEVHAINRFTLEQHAFAAEDCQFGYRTSLFKDAEAEAWIIINLVLQLRAEDSPDLTYTGIIDALSESGLGLSAKSVASVVCDLRRSKLPDPASNPNVGSFFKNVVVDRSRVAELRSAHPDMPMFTAQDGYRIPSAWLIEQAGMKGKSVGDLCVSRQHALVLENNGRASAEEVNKLAAAVKQAVAERFSLQLEQEPISY